MAINWLTRKWEDGHTTTSCPECEAEVDGDLTHCETCGYDIVQQAKVDRELRPPVV